MVIAEPLQHAHRSLDTGEHRAGLVDLGPAFKGAELWQLRLFVFAVGETEAVEILGGADWARNGTPRQRPAQPGQQQTQLWSRELQSATELATQTQRTVVQHHHQAVPDREQLAQRHQAQQRRAALNVVAREPAQSHVRGQQGMSRPASELLGLRWSSRPSCLQSVGQLHHGELQPRRLLVAAERDGLREEGRASQAMQRDVGPGRQGLRHKGQRLTDLGAFTGEQRVCLRPRLSGRHESVDAHRLFARGKTVRDVALVAGLVQVLRHGGRQLPARSAQNATATHQIDAVDRLQDDANRRQRVIVHRHAHDHAAVGRDEALPVLRQQLVGLFGGLVDAGGSRDERAQQRVFLRGEEAVDGLLIRAHRDGQQVGETSPVEHIAVPHVEIDQGLHLPRRGERHQRSAVRKTDILEQKREFFGRKRLQRERWIGQIEQEVELVGATHAVEIGRHPAETEALLALGQQRRQRDATLGRELFVGVGGDIGHPHEVADALILIDPEPRRVQRVRADEVAGDTGDQRDVVIAAIFVICGRHDARRHHGRERGGRRTLCERLLRETELLFGFGCHPQLLARWVQSSHRARKESTAAP